MADPDRFERIDSPGPATPLNGPDYDSSVVPQLLRDASSTPDEGLALLGTHRPGRAAASFATPVALRTGRDGTAHGWTMTTNKPRITGLDGASLIPVGAKLTAAYWVVPGTYSVGTRCVSQEEAFATAIDTLQQKLDRHDKMYATCETRPRHPERIVVDLRWTLEYEGGGGSDIVAERIEYDDLAGAREHLARIRRYSTT